MAQSKSEFENEEGKIRTFGGKLTGGYPHQVDGSESENHTVNKLGISKGEYYINVKETRHGPNVETIAERAREAGFEASIKKTSNKKYVQTRSGKAPSGPSNVYIW